MFTKIWSSKKKPVAPADDSIDLDVLKQGLEDIKKKNIEAVEILDMLEIPHSPGWDGQTTNVEAKVLIKLLSDQKRMKMIMSKMRNKAFW